MGFQEKFWHDGYSKLDLAQFWLEKLGRDLASSLGGRPTLEESVMKQRRLREFLLMEVSTR